MAMTELMKQRLVGTVVLVLGVVIAFPLILGAPRPIPQTITRPATQTNGNHSSEARTQQAGEGQESPQANGNRGESARPNLFVLDDSLRSAGQQAQQSGDSLVAQAKKLSAEKLAQRGRESVEINIPIRQETKQTVKQGSSAVVKADKKSKSVGSKKSVKKATKKIAKKTKQSKPPKSAPKKSVARPPKPSKSQSTGGWVVQIGSFSKPDNARSVRKMLRDRGYEGFIATVNRNQKPVYRVMVGPKGSEKAARKRAERLTKELKQEVRVLEMVK